MPDNILSIPERLDTLAAAERQRFARLFSVQRCTGTLAVPPSLAPKIAGWYARPQDEGAEPALARARTQTLLRTFNRWTGEGAVFNPLRALRPLPPDGRADLARRVEQARRQCDFCDPLNMTTADAWGRLHGRACVTAANAAKFDAHHGLIIFHEHDPLKFDAASVADVLDVAERWFERTRQMDPQAVFPFLSWNCLEKAAASQLHGHLQVLLSSGTHQAAGERLRSCADSYGHADFEREPRPSPPLMRSYFADLVEAHEQVGLCLRRGELALLAYLAPIKEREVMLIAPPRSPDLAGALGHVLRTFVERFGVTCFNVGILYPPPVSESRWAGFPIVARIVDRGPTGSGTVDIGGMELYGTPVVAADPYDVISALTER